MATDLIKRDTANTVAKFLTEHRGQIAAALPRHLTPDRLARVAVQLVATSPGLQQCEARSLCAALVQGSMLGLDFSPSLGQAYLVPFRDNKRGVTVCQFIPGYRGLVNLAWRAARVTVNSRMVHANDHLEVEYGTTERLVHRPAPGERGEPVGVYATARYPDGRTDFEYLSRQQVEAIQARSKAADAGPWKTDPGEMWRKTAVRRLVKRLPMSVDDLAAVDALAGATDADTRADKGEAPDYGDAITVVPLAAEDATPPAAEPPVERANAGKTALPGV